MGMYDTVMVPCPQCGKRAEFQSKSGECNLETYDLDDAPDDVLLDVNRHAPMACGKCDALFGVEIGGQRPRRTLTAHSVIWKDARRCRAYDAACINPSYCDERDACCAGDPNCKPPLETT